MKVFDFNIPLSFPSLTRFSCYPEPLSEIILFMYAYFKDCCDEGDSRICISFRGVTTGAEKFAKNVYVTISKLESQISKRYGFTDEATNWTDLLAGIQAFVTRESFILPWRVFVVHILQTISSPYLSLLSVFHPEIEALNFSPKIPFFGLIDTVPL